ncbi:MAG: hypothetical protein ABSB94_11255 [Syntrophorhabdales bacterium]
MFLIKQSLQVLVRAQHAAKQNTAKDRAEPICPPLMDMVDRPMNLFAPALPFGKQGNEFEGEFIRFD